MHNFRRQRKVGNNFTNLSKDTFSLNEIVDLTPSLKWRPGAVFGCNSSEYEGFYRAAVVEKEGTSKARVQFIDFGNYEVKPLSDLLNIPKDLAKEVSFAVGVPLQNSLEDTEDNRNSIEEKLGSDNLTVTVVNGSAEFAVGGERLVFEGSNPPEIKPVKEPVQDIPKVSECKIVEEKTRSDPKKLLPETQVSQANTVKEEVKVNKNDHEATKIINIKEEKPKSNISKILEVILTMVSRPSGLIGLVILIFHVTLAITSPLYVPHDYKAIDPSLMLQPPSSEFWFGTDSLGRDVFTRTILGGRTALTVTFFGSLIALLWGGAVGIFCGLVGGKIDDVVMRIIDAFLSIPWILAMLLIVSLLGTSIIVLIPALGFFYGKGIVRVARAATHDVIAKDFIVSARARGHSNFSIIWNEILPNVRDAIMVEGAMRWSWMLLGFSSLSFLGFGVSPPTPDWGLMISNARGLMSFAYWSVLAPIFGLSSLIIGINLTADAFAKALGIDRSTKAPV